MKQFISTFLFSTATLRAGIITASILGLSACTSNTPQKPPLLTSIDPSNTQQLLIAKHDPINGQRWSIELKKNSNQKQQSLQWEISIPPEGSDWIDRVADTNFVVHLIDTFRTLEPVELAGPRHTPNFSLTPPLFLLDLISNDQKFKIEVGADDPKGRGTFGVIQGPPQGPEGQAQNAWILKGAAIRMLGFIENAQKLRRQTLLPWEPDHMDEIEVTAFGKKYYAQRQNDSWADAAQKEIRSFLSSMHPQALNSNGQTVNPVTAWLDDLTHLKVKTFDLPLENNVNFEKAAQVHIVFKNRSKPVGQLWISKTRKGLLAFVPARSNSLFELYAESEKLFNKR